VTYREALNWLYGLQLHGIKLGLENMQRLCEELGIDTSGRGACKFIHVAGTNGKGSVCAISAEILARSRQRVGLYTSPHLVSFRERIQLGANLIPEEHTAAGIARIRTLTAGWQHSPTFFEVATALALAWFQQQNAEWAVIETGLGGRLDATNVVTPAVSVLTTVALDHTKYLGTTLAEIAREKAGIIKPGVPVVSAPQHPEVEAVFRETAAEKGSSIHFVANPIPADVGLALAGSHQRMNAAVAFAAVVSGGARPSPNEIHSAFASVEWPGRFHRVNEGRIVLDGAHNPAAAVQLAKTWNEQFPGERATIILGILADKDAPAICAALAPLAARVICVSVRNARTLTGDELTTVMRASLPTGVSCGAAPDFRAAFVNAEQRGGRILVTGSLFLVGEALSHLGLAEGAYESSAQ
jgi:dihydrofolate synthase / folylpolyglutamate synthase